MIDKPKPIPWTHVNQMESTIFRNHAYLMSPHWLTRGSSFTPFADCLIMTCPFWMLHLIKAGEPFTLPADIGFFREVEIDA